MVKTLRRKSALGGGGDRGQPWEAGETEVRAGSRGRWRPALGGSAAFSGELALCWVLRRVLSAPSHLILQRVRWGQDDGHLVGQETKTERDRTVCSC